MVEKTKFKKMKACKLDLLSNFQGSEERGKWFRDGPFVVGCPTEGRDLRAIDKGRCPNGSIYRGELIMPNGFCYNVSPHKNFMIRQMEG